MKKSNIPVFKNEDAEREFWSKNDSASLINWKNGKKPIFPNLKPTAKSISIRLPSFLIDNLKALANKKDSPYQSLMKVFLSERVKEELTK
jgi:predicted DNA binding CopG/RHH family protein